MLTAILCNGDPWQSCNKERCYESKWVSDMQKLRFFKVSRTWYEELRTCFGTPSGYRVFFFQSFPFVRREWGWGVTDSTERLWERSVMIQAYGVCAVREARLRDVRPWAAMAQTSHGGGLRFRHASYIVSVSTAINTYSHVMYVTWIWLNKINIKFIIVVPGWWNVV